jgi:hypothetical protein
MQDQFTLLKQIGYLAEALYLCSAWSLATDRRASNAI